MARPPKLKIALAGLGRIGKKHAINLLNLGAKLEFVAAFSISPAELEWAKVHLEPHGVLLYAEYEQMMYHPDLQAVIIATAAAVHKSEVLRALDLDLHVMCEKPLATDLASCNEIITAANLKPHLKVLCGFTRRFDASYRDAYYKTHHQNLIGVPTIIRSQTCDKYDPSGFFVSYSALSGGIFLDMGIHDIDLSLWFFGDGEEDTPVQPKSVVAYGVAALHPALLHTNDRDNAIGIIEYHNNKLAYIYLSRMMAHGQDDSTEIIGTEGKLSINTRPAKDLVDLSFAGGIVREIPDNFWGRFEAAFTTEVSEFVDCCVQDKKVPMRLETAVKAVEIALALQESLVGGGKVVRFGVDGRRICAPRL